MRPWAPAASPCGVAPIRMLYNHRDIRLGRTAARSVRDELDEIQGSTTSYSVLRMQQPVRLSNESRFPTFTWWSTGVRGEGKGAHQIQGNQVVDEIMACQWDGAKQVGNVQHV